jgi:hypothetical protein
MSQNLHTRLEKLESTTRGRRRKIAVWVPTDGTAAEVPETNEGDEVIYISWGAVVEQDDLR